MKTFMGIAIVACLIVGMFVLLRAYTNDEPGLWVTGYIMIGLPLLALLIATYLKSKQEE